MPAALSVRAVALDTYSENVVLLARDCVALRPDHLAGARKVEVRSGAATLLATPMICDDPGLVGPGEIGLPEPLGRRLNASPGASVGVRPAPPSRTLDLVAAKIAGEELSAEAYGAIAHDLAAHLWSGVEIAAFLTACASFMTPEEATFLTRAMADAGQRLAWPGRLVVDKHSIGGIPGNRTSLIVAPIVAAHGLCMPKTSSRGITSPAGTADTMEVLARVDLTEAEMRSVVDHCGACLAWGGRVRLSPADDVLISVERRLSIDTPEQMVASILSKKLAAGVSHLVLDLPVGPSAKVRDRRAALRLRKLFEHVAARIGLTIEVRLADTLEPVGRGVGPVLEARDVRAILEQRPDAPRDLRDKALALAARVLEADPDLPGGAGAGRALDLLESGAAAARLDAIIAAQGPPPRAARVGDLVHEVRAAQDGIISQIDCLRIATVARRAGAPTDPGAGLDLLHKVGDRVRAGDPLYLIHAAEPTDFGFACDAAGEDAGVRFVP